MNTEQQVRLKAKVIMLTIIPSLIMILGLVLYLYLGPSAGALNNNTSTLAAITFIFTTALLFAWLFSRHIIALLKEFSSTTASTQEQLQSVKELQVQLEQTEEALRIQNIELDLARKRALDASNVKSDFLARMSHEIRTPMNGIVGFANLLKKTDLTPTQSEYVENIEKSSSNLLNLTNGVLSFSNTEIGNFSVAAHPFKLRSSCEECIKQYRQTAHGKQLELILLIYDDVPNNLIGDTARIFQIISNLIDNAIKYTHKGEVVIRVMLEEESDSNCTLQISVTDTGIGIEKAIQKRLFIPFAQKDTSITRPYDGAGLGLSICYRLVQTLHGTISIDSTPGEGSCFLVTLQLDKTIDQPAEKIPETLEGKSIALYDSHKLSRTCICSQLESFSTKVTQYDNADQLLISNHDDFDLIVLGFSGEEFRSKYAAKTVATLRQSFSIPILALLSISEHSSLQSILESGATQCHPKPIGHTELSSILINIFENPLYEYNKNPAQRFINHHFLVVDDDPINHELMEALLENSNAHITHANNGQEAIALAAKYHYSLIIMDIHMPDMSGIEATKIIRSREEPDQHIPIIALTADIEKGIQQQAIEAGIDAYIAKPFSEKDFWFVVDSLFNKKPPIQNKLNGTLKTATPEKKSVELNKAKSENKTILPVYDHKHALNVSGGSETLAEKMFTALKNELPKQLDSMQKKATENNNDELWNIAHRMHGSTAICGVPALNQAVAQFEQIIKKGSIEEKHYQLAQVAHEIQRVLDYSQKHQTTR